MPFEVWYLSDHATRPSFDSGFKQTFAWDLDMLSGYPSRFLKTNDNHDVSRFSQLRLGEPLGNLLRERKVTGLWIQGWQVAAYWQAVWQANNTGVPVWLRGESNDLAPVPRWKKPIKQLALRRFFGRISEFLYIGSANRRFYTGFGARDEQLHPAYYCVDNERFRKQADEIQLQRSAIRRAWRIPEESFCVLFAGKFIEKKRPLDIVDAVAKLRQIHPDKKVHLLFAGSGELGKALRDSCTVAFDDVPDEISVNRNLTTCTRPDASFTGFLNQTQISKAYVAADCLVLPSDHRETWGLVVNEAMASGLPCIVSDACGCAEDLIVPIRPSLRFSKGDSTQLAQAIHELISRPIPTALLTSHVNKFDLATSVATVRELCHKTQRAAGVIAAA